MSPTRSRSLTGIPFCTLRYLPLFPYRDNALLHYYAGLLCIYLAQSEMLQDQARNLALSSSQGFLSSSHPGSMDFGSSQAHLSSSVPFKQARSRSSSTSSSTSTSSSSSNGTIHNLKSTASSSKSANKPKSAHKVYANIKDAIEFSKSPSLQLVQKILQASPIHANDARKWFELARKISSDKGERFDDLDDWLGLVSFSYTVFNCRPLLTFFAS